MAKQNRARRVALGLLLVLLLTCASVFIPRFARRIEDSAGARPCEIVIETLTLGQEMPDLPAVETAINAITLPALNCKVRIKNISIANQKSALRLMHVQNEQIDLVNTGRTDPLTDMVGDGLLLPLDDLLTQQGGALLEDNRELLEACKVNGHIYAVPAKPCLDNTTGFLYNADMAEEYGIHLSDHPDLDELEAVAETLRQHGKYLLLPNTNADTPWLFTALYPNVRPVSSNLYYGAVVQDSENIRIENTFATADFEDYCLRMRRWVEKGWIPDRYLLSGLSSSDEFRKGNIFMMWNGVNPIELALQSRSYPFQIGMFSTGETPLTTQAVQENGWGISSTCANPEAAMALLRFIYENEEVTNLLMNGLEGQEYQKVSDHIITYLDGQSAGDLKYLRQFTLFGDYRNAYEWLPMTEEDYDILRDYYSASPNLDPLFGYSFIAKPILSDSAAVFEVLSDYLPALECGLIEDVTSALDTLNQKLRQAGIDRIIAENQRQLNAWLEGHTQRLPKEN